MDRFGMLIEIIVMAIIFDSVFAEHENKIYIPLVKMQTDSSEVSASENHCVTKEYIDEVFLNTSNRLQDCQCNTERTGDGHVTKEDLMELNRTLMLIANNSARVMELLLYAKPIDCEDVINDDYGTTGIYTIYPYQRTRGIKVRCDMDTSIGGWTVIQRRVSDSEFYRTWDEYESGFGNLSTNFWLGNRYIHTITSQDRYEMRVDLTSPGGETAYAHYREFSVGDAASGYKLFIGGYSGTAGDSLKVHNGMKFTTYDRDNDINNSKNCAVSYHGGWWYNSCHHSNLNGLYGSTESSKGPSWSTWKGSHVPMKITEMKIRRIR